MCYSVFLIYWFSFFGHNFSIHCILSLILIIDNNKDSIYRNYIKNIVLNVSCSYKMCYSVFLIYWFSFFGHNFSIHCILSLILIIDNNNKDTIYRNYIKNIVLNVSCSYKMCYSVFLIYWFSFFGHNFSTHCFISLILIIVNSKDIIKNVIIRLLSKVQLPFQWLLQNYPEFLYFLDFNLLVF
jgi:hypothetical protein